MFEWIDELQASMGTENMKAREADFLRRTANRANLRKIKYYEQCDFFEKIPPFCDPYEADKLTSLDHMMEEYFKAKYHPIEKAMEMHLHINGSTVEYFDEGNNYTYFPYTLGPTYEMLKKIARRESENLSVEIRSLGSITWEVTVWLDLK